MKILCLLLLFNSIEIEKKIKTLEPSIKNPSWIANTLTKWSSKAGFKTKSEKNLILAVAMGESSFIHPKITGKHKEEGILQVIPSEKHIKISAMNYRCHRSEIGKSRKIKVDGKEKWFKPCRCPKGYTDIKQCIYPNIGIFTKRGYLPLSWKTRRFLKASKRGAFVTGMYEMKYWRNRYNRRYKKIFWSKFPKWFYKKKGITDLNPYKKWWKRTKKNLGKFEWIVHYNYGGRVAKSRAMRWYPRKIYKYFSKLEKLDKQKLNKSRK